MELLRCPACEALVVPPARTCDACGAPRLVPARVSGRGTLYSFTTIHAPPAELADQAPYLVAVVGLEEGVLLPARLNTGLEADVQIDSAVRFDHADERGFVFQVLAR